MNESAETREGCTAWIAPGEDGGMTVTLNVPGYDTVCSLTLAAERDADGDWRVYVPWPESIDADGLGLLPDGHEIANGILYIGAPEDPSEFAAN